MSPSPRSHLLFRITAALLAFALFVGPIATEANAAERCHAACDPQHADAETACCPTVSPRSDASGRPDPDGTPAAPGCETETHYCAACTARPLFVAQERPMLALDRAPLATPTFDAVNSASVDVPFAIFHPPRA